MRLKKPHLHQALCIDSDASLVEEGLAYPIFLREYCEICACHSYLNLMMPLEKSYLRTKLDSLRRNQKLMYLLIGGTNTLAGIAIFSLLYWILHTTWHYQAITVLAHFISVFNSWFSYRCFVFKSNEPPLREYLRFNISSLLMLGFHMFGLLVLVDQLHVHPLISQPIVVLCAVVVSYVLHAKFTFRRSL